MKPKKELLWGLRVEIPAREPCRTRIDPFKLRASSGTHSLLQDLGVRGSASGLGV